MLGFLEYVGRGAIALIAIVMIAVVLVEAICRFGRLGRRDG